MGCEDDVSQSLFHMSSGMTHMGHISIYTHIYPIYVLYLHTYIYPIYVLTYPRTGHIRTHMGHIRIHTAHIRTHMGQIRTQWDISGIYVLCIHISYVFYASCIRISYIIIRVSYIIILTAYLIHKRI